MFPNLCSMSLFYIPILQTSFISQLCLRIIHASQFFNNSLLELKSSYTKYTFIYTDWFSGMCFSSCGRPQSFKFYPFCTVYNAEKFAILKVQKCPEKRFVICSDSLSGVIFLWCRQLTIRATSSEKFFNFVNLCGTYHHTNLGELKILSENGNLRREEVIFTCWYIDHYQMSHGFLLQRESLAVCQRCATLLTVKHVVIECQILMYAEKDIFKDTHCK